MSASPLLFTRFVDDAAMFPPGNSSADQAVAAHAGSRRAWFASLVGPLVVSDQRLVEVGREVRRAGSETPVAVSVVITGGAGGVVSLANRSVDGIEVVAVEAALRDLDDLAGNVARVSAAADQLDDGIAVYVEIPYAPGWERAVAAVEAAGCRGKLRTGGPEPADTPTVDQLAAQLSELVEADLPFKATAGLHRAFPTPGVDPRRPAQHGFLTLLAAVDALVEGATVPDTAAVLGREDRDALIAELAGWDEHRAARVRRRWLSFGCCGILDPVQDLLEAGLISGGSEGRPE